MQSLEGRIAAVTGGTKGVGRGVARELAQCGAQVFVTGRTAARFTGSRSEHHGDPLRSSRGRTSGRGIRPDLRDARPVDILVNNVWGGYERHGRSGEFTWPKPFWEQPLWRWDAMFSAGVRAHYHASPARGARHDRPTTRSDRQHLALGRAETDLETSRTVSRRPRPTR